MSDQSHLCADKVVLHCVDHEVRERARYSQAAIQLGYHCELYEGLSEISLHPPRMGIIILRDHPAIGGGIVAAMKQLEELGIWLSVVVAGEAADPGAIVEAIKAGALDYIPIPVDPTLLHVSLTKVCAEDSQRSGMRRRRIEARDKIARLTMRESEVLEFLAAGHSSKAIAHQLGISPRTVELHRSRMMSKLGASHTAGAVRIALDASGAHVTQYAH